MANFIKSSTISKVSKLMSDAIDDLIEMWGKNFQVVYPPIAIPCSCSEDLIGKKGSGIWTTGGPTPNTWAGQTGCKLCNGEGKQYQTSFDSVKMLAYNTTKIFERIDGIDVRLRQSGSSITTKGHIDDLPKILKCEYIIYQIELKNIQEFRFVLDGQPLDVNSIAQGKFFECKWKMVGG